MTQDLCTIVAKPHPFDSEHYFAQAKHGQTIAQMLGANTSKTCSVTVNGYSVPQ